MKKMAFVILIATIPYAMSSQAMKEDDPLLAKIIFDQVEWQESDAETGFVLESQGWIGYDLNKFWLKTEWERSGGENEDLEVQALYSRAFSSFWDIQVGLRADLEPSPDRQWVVLGLQGLAPYFFESDIQFFVNEDGVASLRTVFEYELLLTQKLVLSPEIEANFFSKDEVEFDNKQGLNDLKVGLRLRYEFRREIAPYLGIEWDKQFGAEQSDETRWLIGLRMWL